MNKEEYLVKLKKYTEEQIMEVTMIDDEDDPELVRNWQETTGADLDELGTYQSVGEVVALLSRNGFDAPGCMEHLLAAAGIEADLSQAPMDYDT